mmetsp:Transcript_30390/g.55102  ORF Transcript_30390/g.55102 Transcript_30390/m.55102 type:complete len:241 (-) Transcript_30390:254-976(-)
MSSITIANPPRETSCASPISPVFLSNCAAVLAFPTAISNEAGKASCNRFTMIGLPLASATAIETFHRFASTICSAAAITFSAAWYVMLPFDWRCWLPSSIFPPICSTFSPSPSILGRLWGVDMDESLPTFFRLVFLFSHSSNVCIILCRNSPSFFAMKARSLGSVIGLKSCTISSTPLLLLFGFAVGSLRFSSCTTKSLLAFNFRTHPPPASFRFVRKTEYGWTSFALKPAMQSVAIIMM